ncbi:hypothetical protein Psuf_010450 [Phytohabitans suffuscus]|uniref:Tyr recombinase domain-containing protein n=1 Tax=Phytohabitans suffuscus TaxID=624315 RepID=A0A6F8YCA1_9ACTN|nr:hypothetical protein Psuf_010450 [Phytohabitans suffuscus]
MGALHEVGGRLYLGPPKTAGSAREVHLPPFIEGTHFHDLRHTHKTWLIEDDIPEVAQAKRLGHRLAGV